MTDTVPLDDNSRAFLLALAETTQGDPSAQISMYTIGESLGLEKSSASRAAEELLGWELAEVRTLAGGIGITAAGLAEVRRLTGGGAPPAPRGLGTGPVLDDTGRRAIEELLADVKSDAGRLGLDFDALAELMADLKTLDAQLASPRPKTAVLREALRSARGVVLAAGAGPLAARIAAMIAD